MASSVCGVCHEKEADHRCLQCHKPVCDDDAFKDDQGVFCGRDCAARSRSYAQADARVARARPRRLRGVLVFLVIIALLAFLAIRLGWISLPGGHGKAAQTTNEPAELPEDVPSGGPGE